jgi:hypothetical protein
MKPTPDAEVATEPQTVEDKLDVIIGYLHALDRRDKLRTYGGMVRGVIALIPMILFLASAWYVYQHGDELLTKLAQEAAKQAAATSQDSMNVIFDQFQNYLPTPPAR